WVTSFKSMKGRLPADLVLLTSSDPRGKGNIMTANLDGETNLKTVVSPKATQGLRTSEALGNFSCRIECENPNSDLQKFVGRLVIANEPTEPLCLENLLMRGTSLIHTNFVFGCVVYTGQDTKMSKNSKMTAIKFSTVDAPCIHLRFTEGVDIGSSVPWYLGHPIIVNVYQVLQDSLSFLVLFNYVVPISLYVTLEFQKFLGSKFFVWDEALIDPDTGNQPICNTSDLNEELGQRFKDTKTGLSSINASPETDEHNNDFLKCLALCHTVEVSKNEVDVKYEASSPDEKALVDACRKYGTTFMGLHDSATSDDESEVDILQLNVESLPKDVLYKRIRVLEFDSDRKCMSVIVQDEEGDIRLICKGAESSVLPNCVSGKIHETKEHVDIYGTIGLRTLVVCEKKLTEDELEEYLIQLKEASISLVNRSE
ncbi:Phospholipid-transporting ATPase, partial [Caligus rogercresseyi]